MVLNLLNENENLKLDYLLKQITLYNKLVDFKFNNKEIINYLLKRESEIFKDISISNDVKSVNKCKKMINNIEEFINSNAIKSFKRFMIDACNINRVDIYTIIKRIKESDVYLKDLPFYTYNDYTLEITLNEELLILLEQLLNKDYKLYNEIEKNKRLLLKNKNIIINDNIKPYLNIDLSNLNKILEDINNGNDLSTTKYNIYILLSFNKALKDKGKKINDKVILNEIRNVLEDVIIGRYKVNDILKYQVLTYFDGYDYKFLNLLKEYDFKIEEIINYLWEDELIKITETNGIGSIFKKPDGTLNLANISYANAYLYNETIPLNALNADKKCLNHIKAKESNIETHFYKDKYDLKILLAIALYQENNML